MSKNKKIRVAVLYGGRSSEHEISLLSAANVIKNLDRSRFEPIPVGISHAGEWFLGDQAQLENDSPLKLQQDSEKMLFTPNLISQSSNPRPTSELSQNSDRLFDVVFPAIHGPLCEDGTVQGLLELADLPYVGCGVLASAMGMDKDISKRLVKDAGIAVAPYIAFRLGQWLQNPNRCIERVQTDLQYPVFVKPANTGSSVGISKVKTPDGLKAAIENAFLYDTKILIEQGVDAIELEVSVLESLNYGEEPLVGVVGEIRPQGEHEFYSYQAKYLDENGAIPIIPAPISPEIEVEVRRAAVAVFSALECEGMARVDLFLERGSNQIYFNEINSIPGFTEISMYPKMLAAAGISYPDLLSHLVELALQRHERKNQLNRAFVPEDSVNS